MARQTTKKRNQIVPVRLTQDVANSIDYLVERMRQEGHPAAVGAGGHWGRSALMRLLIMRGLTPELKQRAIPPRRADK